MVKCFFSFLSFYTLPPLTIMKYFFFFGLIRSCIYMHAYTRLTNNNRPFMDWIQANFKSYFESNSFKYRQNSEFSTIPLRYLLIYFSFFDNLMRGKAGKVWKFKKFAQSRIVLLCFTSMFKLSLKETHSLALNRRCFVCYNYASMKL